jgi:hypothetical protein
MKTQEFIELATGIAKAIAIVLIATLWFHFTPSTIIGVVTALAGSALIWYGALLAVFGIAMSRFSEEDYRTELIEQIHADLKSGKIKPGEELLQRLMEAGVYELAIVQTTSPEFAGTFNDAPIYKWVELFHPKTQQIERLHFSHIAGDAEDLPHGDDVLTANINGVIYSNLNSDVPKSA